MSPGPTLVWGIFERGLGVVFLISFLSLLPQVVETAGSGSVTPVAPRLRRIAKDFSPLRRILHFPTLLWLDSSDRMLRALTLLGAIASLVVIHGGPAGGWALATCFVCHLSLDLALALVFPWDCLLFEATALALLLPATRALPSLEAVAAPAPALAWAFRFLVFRVMFGFGKQKFLGSRPEDLAYLKGFLVSQTLPSKIGWYAQKLPMPLLKGAILYMFFVEVIAPFFAFVPGIPSVVLGVSTILLMVGIQVTGTFGYFSILTLVVCVPLFDQATPRALDLAGLFSPGQPVVLHALLALHTLAALAAFPFNSWIAQVWPFWAFWYRLPRFVQPFFAFMRLIHPFRLVHAYGVFPPFTTPSAKITPLVEVSWDEKEWHELEFHFSVTRAKSPPRFIAPYHPRTDQNLIYEAFGFTPNSLMCSVLGASDPYAFASGAFAPAFCQRVLRGQARSWVKGAVLDAHAQPPVAVRLATIMLEPVSLAEHRATGNWWKRTRIGPHTPPQKLDEAADTVILPPPELFHFDAICWRRRSRLGALMQRALGAEADPMQLVLEDPDGLTRDDVDRFWNDFVPLLQAHGRESFDTLPDVVRELETRFDRAQRLALYRLLGRFSMLVIARLEPLYLHRNTPLVPARTYFHLWMLVQHTIGCGRDAYLEAFARPESISRHLAAMTHQTGLYALSVFRLPEATFEAQKLRLLEAYSFPHDPEEKRLADARVRDEALANSPPVERFLFKLARMISGFFWVLPDLRAGFKGPRFDHGNPEEYPRFDELPSGEVVVRRSAE